MSHYEKRIDISSPNSRKYFANLASDFANLASDFVKELPDPTGKFGIPSVRQYSKELTFAKKTEI